MKHTVDNYFFQHNPTPILVIDPENGEIIDFNPAALKYYGYPEKDFRKMMISDINIASNEIVNEEMQLAAQEKRNFFYFQHRLANNEIREVEVNTMLIPFEGKKILLSLITDAGVRKSYSDRLASSKRTLEQVVSDRTEALKKELAFKNVLLDNMFEAVIVCDENGKLVIFNETARKWHGKDAMNIPKEEWSNEYNLYHYDGQTKISTIENPLVRALEGEHVEDMELLIIAKNQPERFVLCSGKQIRRNKGDLMGAIVVLRDDTEQKRKEYELLEINENLAKRKSELNETIQELEDSYRRLQVSEAKFKGIFEMTPSGIIRFDLDGILTEFNESFSRIIGSSMEKLKNLNMLILPNEGLRQAIMQCLKGEKTKFEGLYKSYTSGKETYVNVLFTPMYNSENNLIGGMGLVYDLSELKEKEIQAEHQKKVFEALFKNSPIPTIQFGKNNIIISINSSFTEVFGYISDEVESQEIDNLIASGAKYESARSYTKKVFSGESVRFKAYRYGKCGKEIYADISANRDGKTVNQICF